MVLISADEDVKKVVVTLPEVVTILDTKGVVLIIVSTVIVSTMEEVTVEKNVLTSMIVESLIITCEVDTAVLANDGVTIISLDDKGVSEITVEKNVLTFMIVESLVITCEVDTAVLDGVKIISLDDKGVSILGVLLCKSAVISAVDTENEGVLIRENDGRAVVLAIGWDTIDVVAVVMTASKLLVVGEGVNTGSIESEVLMNVLELTAGTTVELSTREVDVLETEKVLV